MEFGAIVGTQVGPAGLEDDAGEDADPDREQQGRGERVTGGAQRDQLRPLRSHDAPLRDRLDDHRHPERLHQTGAPTLASAPSPARYSIDSPVISMKASSSEACRGASS